MWGSQIIDMEDSKLLRLSLSFALVGLLSLLVMTEFVEPKSILISEVIDNIGNQVYIEGSVQSASYKETSTFFTVEDISGELLVVVFDSLEEVISKGDKIGVSGEASLYKGKLEIIADEITCLKCGS